MCFIERVGSDDISARQQFRCLFSFLACSKLERRACVFLEEILGRDCNILRAD
jgi:hypothetical protein